MPYETIQVRTLTPTIGAEIAGVDLAGRGDLGEVADGGDAIAVDGHVGPLRGAAGPVDDGAVADDQVVRHGSPPRSPATLAIGRPRPHDVLRRVRR